MVSLTGLFLVGLRGWWGMCTPYLKFPFCFAPCHGMGVRQCPSRLSVRMGGAEAALAGDAPSSLWHSDAEKSLSQLASPQPPGLTPQPTPPSPLSPSYTAPSNKPPSPPYRTPPPPSDVDTPLLAKATDPIAPRIEQWLVWPLDTLDGHFHVAWTGYHFGLQRHRQVALWKGGNRVSRSRHKPPCRLANNTARTHGTRPNVFATTTPPRPPTDLVAARPLPPLTIATTCEGTPSA